MPGKMALLDYNKCRPDLCEGGVCTAMLACPLHVLKQEAPHEIPMTDPFACKGCAACTLACPVRALSIVRM
jgi:translation initiation factor RLI1